MMIAAAFVEWAPKILKRRLARREVIALLVGAASLAR